MIEHVRLARDYERPSDDFKQSSVWDWARIYSDSPLFDPSSFSVWALFTRGLCTKSSNTFSEYCHSISCKARLPLLEVYGGISLPELWYFLSLDFDVHFLSDVDWPQSSDACIEVSFVALLVNFQLCPELWYQRMHVGNETLFLAGKGKVLFMGLILFKIDPVWWFEQ